MIPDVRAAVDHCHRLRAERCTQLPGGAFTMRYAHLAVTDGQTARTARTEGQA